MNLHRLCILFIYFIIYPFNNKQLSNTSMTLFNILNSFLYILNIYLHLLINSHRQAACIFTQILSLPSAVFTPTLLPTPTGLDPRQP